MTATADYGVTLVEDFKPPEDMTPSQKVNKDVSAVNTGSVDAFVRMWMDGQMRLLKETDPTVDAISTTATDSLTPTTDQKKIDLGLTYYDGTTYYKTLSTDPIDNPHDSAHSSGQDEDANQPAALSEVQSIMAGSVLVYAPVDADYSWKLEQATELPVYTAASGNDKLVWQYDNTNKKFTIHYEGADDNATTGWNDDIDFTVQLASANIGSSSEQWTAYGTQHLTTFYYNNDLEAGDTARKLVDNVALANTVQKEAYLAVDFDLNVYLESKQVTMDEAGIEKTTPVNSWAASSGNTGAKPSGGDSASAYTGTSEISTVGWVALP